jgi:hypothetical protein
VLSSRLALTAATALAMTGLLLTGCSAGAGAPASSQSVKQACKVLSTDLKSSATDLSSAFSEIQTNPAGAEAALAKFDSALKKSTAKVTNSTIKSAAAATSKAVDSMDTDLKAYVKDTTDTKNLAASSTKVQTTFTKLGSLCSA